MIICSRCGEKGGMTRSQTKERDYPRRIVAEISRNWPGTDDSGHDLVSQRFEEVIAENERYGFELESWRFSQIVVDRSPQDRTAGIVETIVAVFREISP